MRLTTKGRYAVTAMIDLAMHQPGAPVTLTSIAENQGISLSYLERIFAMLRRGNLVIGARGPGGGYLLARDADSISVADIIVAVNEPLDITRCDGRENCRRGERCLSHDLWSALSEQLYAFLNGVRLGELMRNADANRRGAHYVPTPQIGRR
jgi:Rrf2 family iron-sulfur cluster assembly transcriptional regulator